MSTTTLDTDMLVDETNERPAAAAAALSGFGHSLRSVLQAVREGLAAGRHYESLRGQGMGSQEALDRALAETGFGS